MNFFEIGKEIRNLRSYLGLSQRQLAEGICNQSQISRIEAGDLIPTIDILHGVARRLGVEVSYFVNFVDSLRPDYIADFYYQLRHAIRDRDYITVSELINSEVNNPLFNHGLPKQFILWHKGICAYYLEKNTDKAIYLLKEALSVLDYVDQRNLGRQVEIMNSLGIIYTEDKEYTKAERYFGQAFMIHKNIASGRDVRIQIRLIFNYAKLQTILQHYTDSIKLCENGVGLSIKEESMYLLGELYYQIGDNFSKLGECKEAVLPKEKALFIFQITGQNDFVSIVEKEIDDLKNSFISNNYIDSRSL
jgi:transcriptional regulator with XRE-family HTH domain